MVGFGVFGGVILFFFFLGNLWYLLNDIFLFFINGYMYCGKNFFLLKGVKCI